MRSISALLPSAFESPSIGALGAGLAAVAPPRRPGPRSGRPAVAPVPPSASPGSVPAVPGPRPVAVPSVAAVTRPVPPVAGRERSLVPVAFHPAVVRERRVDASGRRHLPDDASSFDRSPTTATRRSRSPTFPLEMCVRADQPHRSYFRGRACRDDASRDGLWGGVSAFVGRRFEMAGCADDFRPAAAKRVRARKLPIRCRHRSFSGARCPRPRTLCTPRPASRTRTTRTWTGTSWVDEALDAAGPEYADASSGIVLREGYENLGRGASHTPHRERGGPRAQSHRAAHDERPEKRVIGRVRRRRDRRGERRSAHGFRRRSRRHR